MNEEKDLVETEHRKVARNAALMALLCSVCLLISSSSILGQAWKDILEVSSSLAAEGKYDSAFVVAAEALALAQVSPGITDTAIGRIYYKMGFYSVRDGSFAEAEEPFLKALDIYRKHLGPTDVKVGKILNALGFTCKEAGAYASARKYCESSIEIMETLYATDDPALVTYIENLALVCVAQSDFERAEPLAVRQLGILEEAYGPTDVSVASALGILGDLYRRKGRYAEAEPLLRRSVSICRQGLESEDSQTAVCLTDLANLLSQCGKFDEAESLFKEALSIWEQTNDRDVQTGIYNLGLNYYRQGDYVKAEPLLKQSVQMMRRMFDSDHPGLAHDLHLLANLYTELGHRREAEDLYLEAIAVSEAAFGKNNPQVALGLNNLALFYTRRGRLADAEPLLQRSLAIYEESMPPGHPGTANAMESLADLYVAMGSYSRAIPLYEKAIGVFRSIPGGQHPKVSTLLISLGETYLKIGLYEKIEPLFAAASEILSNSLRTDHPDMARCLELKSGYLRAMERGGMALDAAADAFTIRYANLVDFSIFLSERDVLDYSGCLRRAADTYLSCFVDEGLSSRRTTPTADIVLASKGIVTDIVANRFRSLSAESDPHMREVLSSYNNLKSQISELHVSGLRHHDAPELIRLLDSLATEANNLEADLARQVASTGRQTDRENITLDRILSALPKDAVLVEYVRFNYDEPKADSSVPRYFAIVVAANAELKIVELGDASEIHPLVDRYRRHVLAVSRANRMPTVVDHHRYKEISEELYMRVWRPLEKHVADKELVLIAPDGALNMVSFAGLMDSSDKYLIEKHAVHYLSAGRDVIRLKRDVEPGSGLFALGDPDYDATAVARLFVSDGTPPDSPAEPDHHEVRNIRSGWGELNDITVDPLPFTRSEVESVVASWQASLDEPVTVYFGSDASEEKLKAQAPGHRVIHLATHGYFFEGACQPDISRGELPSDAGFVGENPLLLSGLLFAGANLHGAGADSVGAEDGILTAYEVPAMDLEGTELVVLSACETGLGKVKEGEGVYGLRRAFQMAGVRTVISALWPVPDRLTADMMSRLYDRTGESLPETLRGLQLESINRLRSKKKADHPYSWGAFIALGDWK